MYRLMRLFVAAVLVVATVPAIAAFNLPGAWNGWDASGNLMNDNLDGTYSLTLSGLTADTRYEFKVVQDGDWGNPSYPGPNSWAYTDGTGAVTVTFNTNVVNDGWLTDQNRIGVSTDPGAWTVVGDFQGWNNANAGTAMTAEGGGIYSYTHLFATAGTYDWKVVNTGSWDSISSDNRSVNTANAQVTTVDPNTLVTFYVDAPTGVVRSVIVPEPASIALLGLGGLVMLYRRRA